MAAVEDTRDTGSDDDSDYDSAQEAMSFLLGGLDLRKVQDTDWETLSNNDDDAVMIEPAKNPNNNNEVEPPPKGGNNNKNTVQSAEDIAKILQRPTSPSESQIWKECMSRVHVLSSSSSSKSSGAAVLLQEPSLRIVDLAHLSKGFGAVATKVIRKGEVIFTEKAAVASQLPQRQQQQEGATTSNNNNTETCDTFTPTPWSAPLYPVRACQNCFCSMEPITTLKPATINNNMQKQATTTEFPRPDLWPVPEYIDSSNTGNIDIEIETTDTTDDATIRVDKPTGRIQCTTCQSLFCNKYCRKRHLDTFGSCCDSTNAVRAVMESFEPGQEVQEPLVLASRIFVMLLHRYRSQQLSGATESENDNGLLGCFTGLCGESGDITPLEIGQPVVATIHPEVELNNENDNNKEKHSPISYSIEPLYNELCKILQVSRTEQSSALLSLERLQQLAAIVARNTHCITTQNPFRPYYNALIRQSAGGRGSEQHHAFTTQVAKALGSEDGILQRTMDKDVEGKCAVQIMGCFPFAARCNHSCDPNAEVRSQEYVDCVIDVVAKRDITVGEEITYSYISSFRRPAAAGDGNGGGATRRNCLRRQRELYAKYLFHCTCQRCCDEG